MWDDAPQGSTTWVMVGRVLLALADRDWPSVVVRPTCAQSGVRTR